MLKCTFKDMLYIVVNSFLFLSDAQAWPLLRRVLDDGKFDTLVDPCLGKNYNSEEMANMVACAAACVRHSAWRRPRMSQVIKPSFPIFFFNWRCRISLKETFMHPQQNAKDGIQNFQVVRALEGNASILDFDEENRPGQSTICDFDYDGSKFFKNLKKSSTNL